ncbi:MAG: AmmeMemoRadiSam system protein A [Candidatus Hydrogenedentota bacterium]|nr:MAG: AmmeMemoRadiSam system protein A [Candidatus Hydrogenedentota bacterium]
MAFTKEILNQAQIKEEIFRIARNSIESGLTFQRPLIPNENQVSELLKEKGASFVTLKIPYHGKKVLRGCIGSLEARFPLYADIAENAFNAAFRDPRFPALTKDEYLDIIISVSVLTQPKPMIVKNYDDLIKALRPMQDGLVLKEGVRKATFLPAVWKELKDPELFVEALLKKGGWPPHYWSNAMQAFRYEAIELEDSDSRLNDVSLN